MTVLFIRHFVLSFAPSFPFQRRSHPGPAEMSVQVLEVVRRGLKTALPLHGWDHG